MSIRLYSTNLSVAKEAAQLISANHITRFHSQNALYIFMEDIKNPWLKRMRNEYHPKSPSYIGCKNYDPSINYLIEKGVFTKHIETGPDKGGYAFTKRITFEVNKQGLQNFIASI